MLNTGAEVLFWSHTYTCINNVNTSKLFTIVENECVITINYLKKTYHVMREDTEARKGTTYFP
jgi:hypothetical protein